MTTDKTPGMDQILGVFIPFFARWLMPQAGCRLLFSIQPFTNIVGNYTCHDGNDK